MKKTYRYARYLVGEYEGWDLIDLEVGENLGLVKTYLSYLQKFDNTIRVSEEGYSLIIKSEISYESFISNPEIALALIKK